jgi:hypothetical protein
MSQSTETVLSTRGQTSTIEDKLIDLLGSVGLTAEQAANACGITVSRVSQLLAQEAFASKVQELRAAALTEANETDKRWSKLENRVLEKLETQIDGIYDVDDLLKAASMLNRRIDRGTKSVAQVVQASPVIQLSIPTVAIQNLVTNINQHVIKAGNQSLITIQSGNMKGLLDEGSMDRSETESAEQPKLSSKASAE